MQAPEYQCKATGSEGKGEGPLYTSVQEPAKFSVPPSSRNTSGPKPCFLCSQVTGCLGSGSASVSLPSPIQQGQAHRNRPLQEGRPLFMRVQPAPSAGISPWQSFHTVRSECSQHDCVHCSPVLIASVDKIVDVLAVGITTIPGMSSQTLQMTQPSRQLVFPVTLAYLQAKSMPLGPHLWRDCCGSNLCPLHYVSWFQISSRREQSAEQRRLSQNATLLPPLKQPLLL